MAKEVKIIQRPKCRTAHHVPKIGKLIYETNHSIVVEDENGVQYVLRKRTHRVKVIGEWDE